MLATETANLVLARILLIRFFEDHKFFGEHRYLCNGGVHAFQSLRETFEQGYTRLLQMAYEKAEKLYAAAFDETELDWVFFADNPNLSNSIEWAMYQLSRYDFTTVKGDILTGVYDRFLDRKQRKRFGEYYTPTSVARYILDAMHLSPNDKVLDPACGSGTFLIERYQQVIGEDVDKGLGNYAEVLDALERIYGNDLNTFSAVLAQIQLLWHALSFKDDLISKGFPDIPVSDKGNSIVRSNLDVGQQGRWAEYDTLSFGGVVGNPPYVRPERSGALDAKTTEYFESKRDKPGQNESWSGISAEANLYALFLYKALDSWCKGPDRHGLGAGKVGFVLPLALCGTNENADIRRLFAPGGRWTITEIVDLELIWRHIFDADVLPIVLIAEARPPKLALTDEAISGKTDTSHDPALAQQVHAARLDRWIEGRISKAVGEDATAYWTAIRDRNAPRFTPDKVRIKLATKDSIHFEEGVKRPSFDFDSVTAQEVDYADVFSDDGRILTRLTPARLAVVRKLRKNPRFETVLATYYYKQRGANRGTVRLDAPSTGQLDWEHREMISRGIVFAGKKQKAAPGQGHTVYKAENIVTGAIFGEPQDTGIDISKARNKYLFAFQDILPERMWAVARIAVTPNAVSFDPHKVAFTDTATVFVPRDKATDFPFDLFFVSRPIRYFYVLSLRMSYMNMIRSDIYPTNLRLLPWSDKLLPVTKGLEALRADLVSACEHEYQTEAIMRTALDALKLPTLTAAIIAHPKEKVEWSESFQIAAEKIEITAPVVRSKTETGYRVQVSKQLFDWIEVQTKEIAAGVAAALNTLDGETIDREGILKLEIPSTAKALSDHQAVVDRFAKADHKAGIEACVDKIDALVGPALGLSEDDLAAIKQDMETDPFFKNVVPRYPASETRLHGYRTGLDSSDRYG
ncbi:N-6 DNA methylase [Roseovarius sp. CAU 1744]|uniref:N-6 DNA methylase n=1 Tax=Roseovarius sp. CAU 1744 TaxID=3140368 RepID=UPI00325C0B58